MAESASEEHLEKIISSAKDWRSSEDPDDPHNWPTWRKIHTTGTAAGLSLVATFASSPISSGLDEIAAELHTSSELARFAFAIYILGLGLGSVLTAPCSETFGRRAVYWFFFPIFALFVLGTGFSHSVGALIVTRFFAGVFASPGLAIGSGVLSDVWYSEQRAVPMALYAATPFLGPALGPLIGGFLVETKGWRWTSWTPLFFFVVFFTPAIFLKESYKRVILFRRAKKLEVPGPSSPVQDRPLGQAMSYFVQTALLRPLHMVFTEPVVAALALWMSACYGMLYGFFASFTYVFNKYYGFSISQTGLTYIGLGVGIILGLLYLILPDRIIYRRIMHKNKQHVGQAQKLAPEHRLYAAMIGGLLMPISLFIFGWTAEYSVHWIVPVIAEAMFGAGIFLSFMSNVMYTMDFYGPLYGASAIAANALLRYGIGSTFPLFAEQMYVGLGVGWASSLLGFCSTAFASIPFLFYHYGPSLRVRSYYQQKG